MTEPSAATSAASSDPAALAAPSEIPTAGGSPNPFNEGDLNVIPGNVPVAGFQPNVFDEANSILPAGTPVTKVKKSKDLGTHDQRTRKGLAYFVVILIAVLYIGSFVAFMVGDFDKESFTTLIAAISGPQALAAAVIGFYYARGHDGKKD